MREGAERGEGEEKRGKTELEVFTLASVYSRNWEGGKAKFAAVKIGCIFSFIIMETEIRVRILRNSSNSAPLQDKLVC